MATHSIRGDGEALLEGPLPDDAGDVLRAQTRPASMRRCEQSRNYWAKLPSTRRCQWSSARTATMPRCRPISGRSTPWRAATPCRRRLVAELERGGRAGRAQGRVHHSSMKGHYPTMRRRVPSSISRQSSTSRDDAPAFSAYGEERMREFRLTSSVGSLDSCSLWRASSSTASSSAIRA